MKNYNKILEAINRGIKFALDDFEDQDTIQSQTNSKVSHQHGTKEWLDLMNDIVDLGLPSGTLWCKYNLDVNPNLLSTPEDWYGSYYAWGELEPKNYYSRNNYKFGKDYDELTKYCSHSIYGLNGFTDNLTQLLPEDDVAYQNKHIGNFKFHIPTKEQCEELIKYTKNYWVYNYDPNKITHTTFDGGSKWLNGRIFEGKNGNLLFIPAAGYRNGSDTSRVGSECDLLSSSCNLDNSCDVFYLYFDSDIIGRFSIHRYNGFTIRPVINL